MFPSIKIENEKLEYIVNTVKSKINYYEVNVNPAKVKFTFFESDNPDLNEKFDELRKILVPEGYIPFLVKDVENYIEVTIRPDENYRTNKVNLIMLILTLASTIYVGSIYAKSFVNPENFRNYIAYYMALYFFHCH